MSGSLVGRVLRSRIAPGDPNVRLLFIVIAEETGNPRQKDPDGWVRLGMRELAARMECGLDTVPDVVIRAEKAGLQVDRPGAGRRMGYRLPPELLGQREHSGGRSRASRARRSVGTTPTEVLGPSQHVPSVTLRDTGGEVQRRDPGEHNQPGPGAVAAGGVSRQRSRSHSLESATPTLTTSTPPELPCGTTPPMPPRPRAGAPPGPARASPSAPSHNAKGTRQPGDVEWAQTSTRGPTTTSHPPKRR